MGIKKKKTEIKLIYNVVLVFGVQQSDSVIYIYIYIYIHTHIHISVHIHVAQTVKNLQCGGPRFDS